MDRSMTSDEPEERLAQNALAYYYAPSTEAPENDGMPGPHGSVLART